MRDTLSNPNRWEDVYYGAMKLYKASHTVFSLKYHIVWITKKRHKTFYRLVANKAKEILTVVGEENDVMIETISVEPDHVHLYAMIGPEQALCDAIAALKAQSCYSKNILTLRMTEGEYGDEDTL